MNHLGLDEKQSQFLDAIANETRLRILTVLNQHGQQTIYCISQRTGLVRKVIQKHLPYLTAASVITERQEERVIRHKLNGDNVTATRTLYGLNHVYPWMLSLRNLLEELGRQAVAA